MYKLIINPIHKTSPHCIYALIRLSRTCQRSNELTLFTTKHNFMCTPCGVVVPCVKAHKHFGVIFTRGISALSLNFRKFH